MGKGSKSSESKRDFHRNVDMGCNPDIVTYGIIVDILCKAGRVDEAVEVVKDMDASNCRATSFIYSVLVHTYGVELWIEDAIDTFLEMERNGIKAVTVVYNALISVFCKVNKFKSELCEKGNVTKACVLLENMIEKGIRPSGVTFGKLRQLLVKEGREDVLKFLREKMNLLVKEPLFD